MIKIYSVKFYNDEESEYVAYHKTDTHIYLVLIDNPSDADRFIRIKKSQYNQKLIYDYEEAHAYTYDGLNWVYN